MRPGHLSIYPPPRKEPSAIVGAISIMAAIFIAVLLVNLCGCSTPHRTVESSDKIERFSGRTDGLIWRETWLDRDMGGGIFFGADPTVQSMTCLHTNQNHLGGGSQFSTGTISIVVSTNDAGIVGAAGTAAGNIIKAVVTKP